MEKRNNKNKKRLLILVALVGVMGIGGVVAATSISINSGTPLSLGAGYATATTCDAAVTVAATQAYDTGTNVYKITAFTVTGVDISPTDTTTAIGCGATTRKVMQLAYVTTSNTAVTASWTLASISGASPQGDSRVYTFGATGDGSVVSSTYYASVALTSFSISTLQTVALSIA
ncbi:MAG: hypothetical protein NTV41_05810 [Actinobacteria bacterium]|nr:hypothetical protein [Actinomycetota bacterium]